MTCCQGSTGMPRSRAARSSGWSGSTAVSAFVTARRSGLGAAVTWDGSCTLATTIPAASSAAVYGDGPPASQPDTTAPDAAARRAAALAPAPPAPTTWMRSPARIARASRAGARPAPMAAASRVTRRVRRDVRAAAPGRLLHSSACYPRDRCPRRTGVRHHRSCRRRPRTSDRPVSRPCLRRALPPR